MPKIRGVKPDYWTDEAIVDLTIPARLLFVGLWNYACDNGHLQDKSKQIKMRLLPADDINVAELLRELEAHGRIERTNGWITVPNFTKHQKPDKRYFQTCDAPGCERPHADSPPGTRGGHHESPTSARSGLDVVSQGPHVDGDGDGDVKVMVKGDPAGKPAKSSTKKPTSTLPASWVPTDDHAARCLQDGIDLTSQVAKFRAHAEANDRRQVNWNAAFTQWLLNVPEWQRGTAKTTKPRAIPHAAALEQPPDGLSDAEYAAWERDQRERRQA